MPQIKDWKGFEHDLKKSEIQCKQENVSTDSLIPTQSNFKWEKVAKIGPEKGYPIYVTRDNHILDGHHRWLAAHNCGDGKMDIKRINLDIEDALDFAQDKPYMENKGINEAYQPTGKEHTQKHNAYALTHVESGTTKIVHGINKRHAFSNANRAGHIQDSPHKYKLRVASTEDRANAARHDYNTYHRDDEHKAVDDRERARDMNTQLKESALSSPNAQAVKEYRRKQSVSHWKAIQDMAKLHGIDITSSREALSKAMHHPKLAPLVKAYKLHSQSVFTDGDDKTKLAQDLSAKGGEGADKKKNLKEHLIENFDAMLAIQKIIIGAKLMQECDFEAKEVDEKGAKDMEEVKKDADEEARKVHAPVSADSVGKFPKYGDYKRTGAQQKALEGDD